MYFFQKKKSIFRLKNAKIVCPLCGFPMCSTKCSQIKQHSEFECKLFQEKGFRAQAKKFKFDGSDEPVYSVISPLRALVLKAKDPQRWNLVWSHMSHDSSRKKSAFWREKTQTFIDTVKVSSTYRESKQN